ncbi:uncharacterized protein LOC133799565 [Humulus lupulus]|uniref:uncharacterized protein LOC133799565 n=1 Tax=Humulus lupulus TaxID=3486 RepID=UPI002B40B8F3|nr:uncharacterized protein LOC133799565 [Humulus lupulus]
MDNCNILSWNIRGLNSPKKHIAVLDICRKNKVGVGAILETKMKGIRVQELMTNEFRNWDFYTSPVTEGRILIIWRKVFVKVSVLEENNQFIHCLIKMTGHKHPFSVTFVYGRNTLEERKALWQGLSQIDRPVSSWMILGDFNAIFTAKDRSGGKPVSKMELLDSSQWLVVNHLEALKSTGSFFTWTNNQDGAARIYSKTDHVFINEEWMDGFPNTLAVYNWETISDHCSCIIFVMTVENMGVKLFRFYNFWVDHVNFKQMVLDSWRKPMKGTGVHYQKAKDQYQEALLLVQHQPSNLTFQDKVKVTAENFRIQEQRGIMGSPSSASKELNKQCVEMGTKLSLDQQLDIDDEFCRAIGQFFEISIIPEELLNTTLSLIPKVDNPNGTVDYKPIAYDLLLFCKGSLSTVKIIKNVIGEFSSVIGLQINESKSQVYFGGVSAAEKIQISAELNLSEGSFPLKYLGVPMRPTKWKHEDCDIIIQKIKMRLHTWASRHLSFAGRMQLIHSVLFGLRNYWMSIFVLPQSIIKEVERLCRGFLWGVNGNMSKIHMDSWAKVCLPKAYGGLGFRNGQIWNYAILAKYMWAISEKHDLLWVKWINSIYLKGSDFWSYRLLSDTSWYWRKLCKLRGKFSCEDIKAAGSTEKFQYAILYNSTLSQQQVGYYKAVWCRLSLPKYRFLLWQVVNAQLLTCDNLLQFRVPLDSILCPVCGSFDESHSHLFFDCTLSKQVLDQIFKWMAFRAWPYEFDSWRTWLSSRNNGFLFHITNMILAAVVYIIWRNRNGCIFDNFSRTATSITSEVKSLIQHWLYIVSKKKLSSQEQRVLSQITM